MTLDFRQVLDKVKELGAKASQREQEVRVRREIACDLLENHAERVEALRQKVQQVVRSYDASLRCALPVQERLNAHFPTPQMPPTATLLAVDGSQINPDRHAEVQYSLINLGAIQLRHGDASPPSTLVECRLYYEEGLLTRTEAELALERDLGERMMLVELARQASPPVITLTDGPLELWGAKDARGGEEENFAKSLRKYLETLSDLCSLGVITAGYVDKPGANLVVRLLEVAIALQPELEKIRDFHPLGGVTDAYLFYDLLAPGERSAVFAMQSPSVSQYTEERALHFFYLNVGRPSHPWIVRVDIPRWVIDEAGMLHNLHATLWNQCQALGARPYPYLLHRAHETAVVTQQEREQVTQMILLDLRRRGVEVGEASYKQSAKDLAHRTRY